MSAFVALLGSAAIIFLLVWIGARRFAKKEQRLGEWDKYGPLVETEPPPHAPRSGLMSWHREVAGKWKGKVLRERTRGENPADSTDVDIR